MSADSYGYMGEPIDPLTRAFITGLAVVGLVVLGFTIAGMIPKPY